MLSPVSDMLDEGQLSIFHSFSLSYPWPFCCAVLITQCLIVLAMDDEVFDAGSNVPADVGEFHSLFDVRA